MILAKLKADAEAKLGETITQAVITVPAYFNDSPAQRHQGRRRDRRPRSAPHHQRADRGLARLRPRQEEATRRSPCMTSAAARSTSRVLEIGDGVFEVMATNGDTHLGGDDWDNALIDWIVNEFKADSGIDLSKQPDALQRIKEEAEKAKIALSSSQSYDINLPFITADATGPKHIQKTLTRAKMEQLTRQPLRAHHQARCKDCSKDAKLDASKIDELVLVGGMTRMPKVVETAQQARRQRAAQGREPGRSRRHRRSHPGRRAQGRREGRAPARRDPAHARHRDRRRRRHADDPAQHHDPDAASRRSSPPTATTSPAWKSSSCKASARCQPRQQERSAPSSSTASRPRRAACRRSRSPSTSTPTASCTSPPRIKAPARSRRSPSRAAPASARTRSRRCQARRRSARRGRQQAQGSRRSQEQGRQPQPTRCEKQLKEWETKVPAEQLTPIKDKLTSLEVRHRSQRHRQDEGPDRGTRKTLRRRLPGRRSRRVPPAACRRQEADAAPEARDVDIICRRRARQRQGRRC